MSVGRKYESACERVASGPAGLIMVATDAGDAEIRRVLGGPPGGEAEVRRLVIRFGRHRVCAILRELQASGELAGDDEVRARAILDDVLDGLDGLYEQGVRWIPRWQARTAEVRFPAMSEFRESSLNDE